MFINGAFVGATFVTVPQIAFQELPYNKVTIFGEGTFDKIWIRNIAEDEAYYDAINSVIDYQPTFDSDTVFLAEFENSLSAGNVESGGEEVIAWVVNKRNVNGSINYLVGEFEPNITETIDFRTQDGESYIYQITPKTATKLGQPLVSDTITSEYYGIFLIDEDTGLSLNFDLNGSISTLGASDDQTTYNTFNQFPTISIGDRNYLSGTIRGIVPENLDYCDNGFIQSADFIDTVQDFVNNKSRKLLKTRKGDIFEIITRNFNRSQWVNELQEQVDVVSFDFVEVEQVNEYK